MIFDLIITFTFIFSWRVHTFVPIRSDFRSSVDRLTVKCTARIDESRGEKISADSRQRNAGGRTLSLAHGRGETGREHMLTTGEMCED